MQDVYRRSVGGRSVVNFKNLSKSMKGRGIFSDTSQTHLGGMELVTSYTAYRRPFRVTLVQQEG